MPKRETETCGTCYHYDGERYERCGKDVKTTEQGSPCEDWREKPNDYNGYYRPTTPDKHDEEGNLIEQETDNKPIRWVVKSYGQCHSIDGMRECSYWSYITSPRNTERDRHRCLLFGGVDKHATQSLVCCDKIYGSDYQGRP